MRMRMASFCPSFFQTPLDSTTANRILGQLTTWTGALDERRFKIVFSPSYINRLQKWAENDLPKEWKSYFSDWLSQIFSTASMMPFKFSKNGKTCLCPNTNNAWAETLNSLQSQAIYVVAVPHLPQSCFGHEAIADPKKIDSFREFDWLMKFRSADWYLIPIDGESSFRPPKTWDKTPFYTAWPEFNEHKGYLDEKNQLWVYDRKESHWDVYSKHERFYCRITPDGKQLAKKPVRLRRNRSQHNHNRKEFFS